MPNIAPPPPNWQCAILSCIGKVRWDGEEAGRRGEFGVALSHPYILFFSIPVPIQELGEGTAGAKWVKVSAPAYLLPASVCPMDGLALYDTPQVKASSMLPPVTWTGAASYFPGH